MVLDDDLNSGRTFGCQGDEIVYLHPDVLRASRDGQTELALMLNCYSTGSADVVFDEQVREDIAKAKRG